MWLKYLNVSRSGRWKTSGGTEYIPSQVTDLQPDKGIYLNMATSLTWGLNSLKKHKCMQKDSQMYLGIYVQMILSTNILFNADRHISHFIFMEKTIHTQIKTVHTCISGANAHISPLFQQGIICCKSRLPVPPRRNILPLKTTSWLQYFSETHTLYINVM